MEFKLIALTLALFLTAFCFLCVPACRIRFGPDCRKFPRPP